MASEGGEEAPTIDGVLAESAEVLKQLKELSDKQPAPEPEPDEVDTDGETARREQESKKLIGASASPSGTDMPLLPPPRADLVEQLKAESRKAQRIGSPIRGSTAPTQPRAPRPK